jgi:hypothetical protein
VDDQHSAKEDEDREGTHRCIVISPPSAQINTEALLGACYGDLHNEDIVSCGRKVGGREEERKRESGREERRDNSP